MAKKRSKELISLDYLLLLLSPLLVVVSGYMYQVTREDRYAFGSLIGEHVSNFFGTAIAMYFVTALTTALEKNTDFETVKKLAFFMQIICAVALLGINFGFENFEGNGQFQGDMLSAILALAIVWTNTRWAYSRVASRKD